MKEDATFIRIPKTASTSVTYALMDIGFRSIRVNDPVDKIASYFNNKGWWLMGHQDFGEMVEKEYISRDYFNSSFKFTIVRDPYTRAVSLFHYLRGTKHNCRTFKDFCKKIQKGVEPIGLYNRKGLSQCNPQTDWMYNCVVDDWGHLETLQRDLNRILMQIGFDKNISIPKHRNTGIKDYDAYYDRETRDIINSFYESDFQVLGYQMK